MSLFGTSFAAAIPGGLLGYFLLMSILSDSFDNFPMPMAIIAITTLVMASFVAILPLIILVFYRANPAKAKPAMAGPAAAPSKTETADEEDEPAGFDEDLVEEDEFEETADEFEDDDDFDEFEAEDDLEVAEASSDADLDEFDDFDDDDGEFDEEFEFEEFDDEDEFK